MRTRKLRIRTLFTQSTEDFEIRIETAKNLDDSTIINKPRLIRKLCYMKITKNTNLLDFKRSRNYSETESPDVTKDLSSK